MKEGNKEITFEEARKIAGRYMANITRCAEYPDAFWFSNPESSMSFG